MGQALLVTVDIPFGWEYLRALDAAELDISVALWAYTNYYDEWRYILASKKLDTLGVSESFGAIRRATDVAGIRAGNAPSPVILSLNSPVIRDLRRKFAKSKDLAGTRIGGTFGDWFIEDGYIYRIS
jgi:hypothetical protein